MIVTKARIDDHRPTLALPTGHPDDVARLQDRQRLQRLGASVRASLAGGRGLQIGELCPPARVPPKVAKLAGRRSPVSLNRLLIPCQGAYRPDYRTVRLELRKGLLEEGTGTLPANACHQVHCHVVGRSEGGPQRIGATRGQPGNRPWIEAGLPENDRVT